MLLQEKIWQTVPGLHGWCSAEKAITLASLVLAYRPKVILECGVWGGKSALPMMLACQQIEHGKVVCVDPWSPDESLKGQTTEIDREWWSSVANHELVYQHFKYNVEKLGLTNYCEVHRISSDDARSPNEIGLVHIDGNHGPQAFSDTVKFASNVSLWGFCVLDDIEWDGGHVRRAEAWLLGNGFVKLHPLGTGAVYMRVA